MPRIHTQPCGVFRATSLELQIYEQSREIDFARSAEMMARKAPSIEFAIVSIVFVVGASIHASRTIVTYRSLAIGANELEIGIVASAFAAFPVLAAIWVGRQTDRGRGIPLLIAGTSFVVLGCIALAASREVWSLALGATFVGFGQVGMLVSAEGLIAQGAEEHHQDKWFGWLTATLSLNQFVGPLSAGLWIGAGGPSNRLGSTAEGLLAAAALAVLALPIAVWIRSRGRREGSPAAVHEERVHMRRIVGAPGAGLALFTSVAITVCLELLVVYLPLLGEERGISPAAIGALLAVRAATSLLARLIFTRILRVVPRMPLLIGSLLLPAICLMLLPLADGFAMQAGILAIVGFTLGLGTPLSMTWLVQIVPAAARGTALGVRLMVNRAGVAVLPLGVAAAGAITGAAVTTFALPTLGAILAVAGLSVVPARRATGGRP